MGLRYDFELTVNLKEDTPDDVVRTVAFLMGQDAQPPTKVPDDPFFDGDHWRLHAFAAWATSCDPHAGDTICSFRSVYRYTRRLVDHHQYTLHLRFCDRAEGLFEVALPFALWTAKWSDQNECVGYYKREDSRHPALLYFHDGELYIREVSEPPQRVTDGRLWN